jgi:hypothetical protein
MILVRTLSNCDLCCLVNLGLIPKEVSSYSFGISSNSGISFSVRSLIPSAQPLPSPSGFFWAWPTRFMHVILNSSTRMFRRIPPSSVFSTNSPSIISPPTTVSRDVVSRSSVRMDSLFRFLTVSFLPFLVSISSSCIFCSSRRFEHRSTLIRPMYEPVDALLV